MRGTLPQALLVRGKSTSRHTAAAPAGRLTVGDAGAPSPGIIVPGLRSPAQVANLMLWTPIGFTAGSGYHPASSSCRPRAPLRVPCDVHHTKALADAPLGQPLRAARRTVSSPQWWDWPQVGFKWSQDDPKPVPPIRSPSVPGKRMPPRFSSLQLPAYYCTACPRASVLCVVF